MGGPGDPTLTLASRRRSETHEERRAAFERLTLVGSIAWPLFAAADVLGAHLWHREQALPALLALRAMGTVIAMVLFAATRWGALTPFALALLDYVMWVMSGGFVAAMALQLGGLTSPQFAGIILLIAARAALVPSHWLRTLSAAGMAGLMWPSARCTRPR